MKSIVYQDKNKDNVF